MGKHYTTEVEEETIVRELAPQTLATPVARTVAEAVADGIRGISTRAASATLRYRREAARAVRHGAQWARDRYEGNTPNTSDRLFNDSGELARGITAVDVDRRGTWDINAPANRFVGTTAAVTRMVTRLLELVPALRDPTTSEKVRAAMEAAAGRVLRRGATKRTTY